MRTVELLPDPSLDSGVRDLWSRLQAAGLPSLATHAHPTNRPHLTVLRAPGLAGLPPLHLPVAAELGPVRMLGRALVREVAPTASLRNLHDASWSALVDASAGGGGASGDGWAEVWPPPGEWVPHVSLALRVPPELAPAMLTLLAGLPTAFGQFVAARSYDSHTRTVVELPVG